MRRDRPPLQAPTAARAVQAWLRGLLVVVALGCGAPASVSSPTIPPVRSDQLQAPSAFDVIADRAERSRAIFVEASRVLFDARCANCHPNGDAPTQRDAFERHDPPVQRGEHDEGVPGLMCSSCHQDTNATLARVPGAPKWQLAPREMAWQGRSVHEVCEQIKDPNRNGHRPLDAIVEHVAHDPLVGWGWHPGADRKPAPGTQAEAGALIAAWIGSGAECPPEDGKKVVSR
jgi:hypothetical protein